MNDRVSLGRIAMRNAFQVRRTLSVPREMPINVYDVSTALGVEVRFLDRPSLEGMFYRGPQPIVMLPSWDHRPRARIAFTCAHELGHFQLGHGTHVDEYVESSEGRDPKSDEEFAADIFATSLLMPRPAVLQRFSGRNWDLKNVTPHQVFIVAGELGVGYTTLIKHLRYGLELVSHNWMKELLRATPKLIRQELTGLSSPPDLCLVDEYWPDVPIDIEVGDAILVPPNLSTSGSAVLQTVGCCGRYTCWKGKMAGLGALIIGEKKYRVRVAKSGFCGLLRYRFLEDPEEK